MYIYLTRNYSDDILDTSNTDNTDCGGTLKLDNNKKDIYIQIKQHFQRLIENKVLIPGQALPSLRKVAYDLGVNPNTVDKAYRMLELEGYIEIFPKKGAFVKEDQIIKQDDRIKIFENIIDQLKEDHKKEELIKLLEEYYDRN